MNKEILLELVDFVNSLNDSMYDHIAEDVPIPGTTFEPFTIHTDGEDMWVNFMLQEIWNSYEISVPQSIEEIKDVIIEEAEDIVEGLQFMKVNDPRKNK